MGLRFRKRIRLGKYLHWNLNWSKKNGITNSASIGQPGANINVGIDEGKVRVRRGTVGIPGSGVRYDTNFDLASKPREESPSRLSTNKPHPVNPFTFIAKLMVSGFVLYMFYRLVSTFIG